ncbi:4Fe-4S binding protein, partial [Escherichia coli]|uniref:4Fe-4S binding protein n=1 Tax=Escherichia coli TaxID=562 RepID=UPI003CE57924
GTVCVVGKMRDLILQLSKSSIYSTKPCIGCSACTTACPWMMATVNTESKKSSKCVLCGECANACPTGALKIIEWKDITV